MKKQYHTPKLILGSSSVYRQQLLERLQIPFETASPDVDETRLPNEKPEETALRLAEMKARAVAKIFPQGLIIGSDQVAILGNTQLGKPLNHSNAIKQLQLIRGKEIVFYTALCLLNANTNHIQCRIIPYNVKFRQISDQQIENYLRKEQPYHCAGSAKSEGLGIALTEMLACEGIEIV